MPEPGRLLRRAPSATLLCLVWLGTAEVALRIVHSVRPLHAELGIAHPRFHHWHRSDYLKRSRTRHEGGTPPRPHRTTVRTNRHGMMGPPVAIAKPSGTRRIAVLGDSFVEGLATEEHETLTAHLESLLEAEQEDFEVLNFGCSSYSPSTEYFNLVYLASRFDPDLVVSVFHFTDVTNDWARRRAAVRDPSGEVIALDGTRNRGGPVYAALKTIKLLRVPVQAVKRLERRRDSARPTEGGELHLTGSFFAMFKPSHSPKDEAAWELTLSYLTRTLEWSRDNEVPFLLVALPMAEQLDTGREHEGGGRFSFGEAGESITSTKMQDILASWAATHRAPFLDLLPVARDWMVDRPDDLLFFPLDGHLTPAGNRMAAAAIASAVRAHGLLAPGEDRSGIEPKQPARREVELRQGVERLESRSASTRL